MIHFSLVANLILFFIFYRLYVYWEKSGQQNFFIAQVKASFNLIKGAILTVGATNDRALNLWFKGENDPIRPMSKGQGVALQYDPQNLYHTAKGHPAMFAFAGHLSNSDPLKDGNDDIELKQMAQANEVFVEEEIKRKFLKQNPFDKIRKFQIATIVILLLGFGMIYYYVNEFNTTTNSFKEEVFSEWNELKPKVDEYLSKTPTINESLSPGVEAG